MVASSLITSGSEITYFFRLKEEEEKRLGHGRADRQTERARARVR